MIDRKIKYSIVIPVYNGGEYLSACINTIIKQDYSDYELIISNDQSTDNTSEYLATLNHPNIKILIPPVGLSMTEHWEWALSNAKGEWQMFVGQDDGLQTYFFKLADILTDIANNVKSRLIMTERAYYFWPGCEFVYGDVAVAYRAFNKFVVKNCKYEALKALFGFQEYFELPQMYTTSLFHIDLINEARSKQNGRLLVTHPQDANLAVIACSLEQTYLKSSIPFGWVGSSPKSAGMAVTSNHKSDLTTSDISILKNDYINKIKNSKLKYNTIAGDFEFGNLSLYLWQSFLQTKELRVKKINKILISKYFKIIFFSQILNEINNKHDKSSHLKMFIDILKRNNCNYLMVKFISFFTAIITKILLKFRNLRNKILNKFKPQINYTVFRKSSSEINLNIASEEITQLLINKGWLNKI
jgi:glycosyltransferase involved in cell wall biosynthesis